MKNNKKAIWMLVILNFYMLPMNIKSIFQENNSKEVVNDTYYDESEKLIEQISEWLKVTSLDIDSIEATGNKGMISVLNKDVLCEVENQGYEIIKITQDNSIYKAFELQKPKRLLNNKFRLVEISNIYSIFYYYSQPCHRIHCLSFATLYLLCRHRLCGGRIASKIIDNTVINTPGHTILIILFC